jgi:transposase-like protein
LLVENTVQEWYDAKHATSSIFEIEFINSLDIEQCPFCGSNGFIKYDHKKDGTQRYICKECGKCLNFFISILL